jgi:hypothetical protein
LDQGLVGALATLLIKHTPLPILQHLSKDYFIFILLFYYYYFLGFFFWQMALPE